MTKFKFRADEPAAVINTGHELAWGSRHSAMRPSAGNRFWRLKGMVRPCHSPGLPGEAYEAPGPAEESTAKRAVD